MYIVVYHCTSWHIVDISDFEVPQEAILASVEKPSSQLSQTVQGTHWHMYFICTRVYLKHGIMHHNLL